MMKFSPIDEWVARCFRGARDKTQDLILDSEFNVVQNELETPGMFYVQRLVGPSSRQRLHALTHIVCNGSFLQVKEMEGCKLCPPS